MAQGRDDVMGKVILGATGVALAAGGVAAAAALANSRNRNHIKKTASRAFKKLGSVRETLSTGTSDRYQAFQHRIGIGKKKSTGAKSASKKSSHKRSSGAVLHKISASKKEGGKESGGMMKKSAQPTKGRGKH